MKQTTSICLLLLVMTFSLTAKEIVSPQSTWRYYDDISPPRGAWKSLTYNDATWSQGKAQFGYGERDETTVTSYGQDPKNKIITQYFRKTFKLDTSKKSTLILRYIVDDGAIFYINEKEVHRVNLPKNAEHNTLATSSDIEHVWVELPIEVQNLQSELNVIAVEVHQLSASSSDLSFDAALISPEKPH